MITDVIVKEVATKINKVVNIPILSEKTEQKFFEMLARIALEVIDEVFLNKLLQIKK